MSLVNTRAEQIARGIYLTNRKFFMDYSANPAINNQWNSLYETMKINKKDHVFQKEFGIGLLEDKAEGRPMKQDKYGTTYSVRLETRTLASSLIITKEALNDASNDTGGVESMAAQVARLNMLLANAATETKNIKAMELFNLGHTANGQQVNGQPFFSSAHRTAGGGTYSNQLTNGEPITTDAFERISIAMNAYRSDTGYRIPGEVTEVLYSFEKKFDLCRTLDTTSGQPGTANHDVNAVAKMLNISRIESHYLENPLTWFARNGMAKYGLVYLERSPLQTDAETMKTTLTYFYTINTRYVFGGYYPLISFRVAGA